MTKNSAIYGATVEIFPDLVVENFGKGLLVVSFSSPAAAPCRDALDRLIQLAAEFGGRFSLVHWARGFNWWQRCFYPTISKSHWKRY